MKRTLVTLLLVFAVSCIAAQERVQGEAEIYGTIVEQSTNNVLPFASVVLKTTEQKLIQGVITNEQGNYILTEIPVGNYILEVIYAGFQTYSLPIEIKEIRQKLNLGSITLQKETVELDAVTIQGEKSQVSLRLDKKVFEVGKDILSQSGSVTDVLGNVPSVAVDPSGAIQLRGNGNVTILINGRRSGLTSSQALEQIPSDTVERVEVITTPSARYDASGSAGIINIILKKNRKGGLTGQLRGVVGTPDDYRLVGSMSYKTNSINLFANVGGRYTDYNGDYSKVQQTTRDDNTIFLNQVEDQSRHDDGRLFYVGADYYFNEHNSITTAFYRAETEDTDETVLDYRYSSGQNALDSLLVTHGNSKEKRSYNQLEMNYTKTFKKQGKKLTFDLQYDFWDSTKKWDVRTQKEFPIMNTIANIRTTSTDKNNDLVMQSDFITPISKSSQIELGAKYENRLVEDGFMAQELVNEGFQLLDNLDNAIKYDEQILGVYTQYRNKTGKFSYLLGLRIEDTKIGIKDANGSFDDTRNYTNLFLTINLGYAFGENTTFSTNYSKRINRPSLWQLNPFSELDDFNVRFFGNPALDPAFTDAIEISLLQKGNGFTLSPSVYYSYTTDDTQWYTTQDNTTDVFISRIINMDKETRYGFELSTSYKPIKWLGFNADFNAYLFEQKGAVGTQNLDNDDTTWYTTLNTRIQLKHGITFQSRFNYRGERKTAQTRRKAISYLNFGISKRLFKNNGTLMINASNVFNSRKTREVITGTDFLVNQTRSRYGARWSLSFAYRFNGNSKHEDRRARRGNRN
ncbi:TonB-dependent receptor [Aquimarina sp. 2201CG1-2-11]|uniref:TonB-dependent receptor domain-containing protein n=1 Tax=Aquimarina discodermiae TaxID=3231043 RepID=UPI003462B128